MAWTTRLGVSTWDSGVFDLPKYQNSDQIHGIRNRLKGMQTSPKIDLCNMQDLSVIWVIVKDVLIGDGWFARK